MAILPDLRYAVRMLGRSPLFTLTSVASLAIGIAAATTIFSLTDALLFEPAPGVRDGSRVVDIGRANQGESGFDNMSYPAVKYLKDHTQTLEGIAALNFGGGPMTLSDHGASERIFGMLVSGNYFDVLGTQPALGRFFRPDEDEIPGERPVVVLSHAFWERRFNRDPEILQKPLRLNNQTFTVVGVAEPGFNGSSLVGTEAWVPMAMVATVRGMDNSRLLTQPSAVWTVAIGRLKPGITAAQSQAELVTLMEAFKASEPLANPRHTIAVIHTSRIPGPMRTPFLAFIGFLFALTSALVAIACSNVGGMLLARAATRRREMATRLAVGAGRGRLIAQLLTETVVLFAVAGAAALPLTFALIQVLESFLPALPVMINLDLSLNWRVMLFAMGVALAAGLVFGLAPARHALGADLAPMLHGANATVDRRRFRLRNVLVAGQVALSLMLVVIAFLFVRTLQAASTIDTGFETANVQIASVDVSLSGYRGQDAVALAERYEERLRAISGVTAVATARMVPLQGGGFGLGSISVPGVTGPERDGSWDADWDIVSAGYFETVDMAIVEGRAFTAADRESSPRVTVLNQTFARRLFPGRSAVGQQVMHHSRDAEAQPLTVVGVAADAKYRYVSDGPRNFVYVPLAQQAFSEFSLFVKHAAGRPVATDIRSAMTQVEPNVPIVILQSFEDAVALGLLPQQLTAWIAGSVGSIGVGLAALGLYGLMAFLVTQRTREIAIRMALGASNGNVRSMVMKQAAWLGMAGVTIGLLLAGVVGTLAQSLLVGVTAIDPVAFGGTALLFAVVLAAACWAPASRAAATDPAVALRSE
ncbi:MAG: ABC transporter permease [Acidobacteriota bacterium]|nr:ABC transporter permease [Acidobacteriota bacterium]